ncbi:MAG: hypothetical protein JXQ75_14520 [Phycisphaerae bacterium]|nr:hypothetical protein [Phycisphaerae bacterium]
MFAELARELVVLGDRVGRLVSSGITADHTTKEFLAELGAACFRLYGIRREDVEYILSTFTVAQRRDEAEAGSLRTADLILASYDQMA